MLPLCQLPVMVPRPRHWVPRLRQWKYCLKIKTVTSRLQDKDRSAPVKSNITVLTPRERAKNACGISQPSLLSRFAQNYYVAMATSLAKSENKVQIPHLHTKCSHSVKRLRKSAQYIWRYIWHNMPNYNVNTQRNFHLLACSPKLLNRSSPKFYTI